jgi:hypothetical protein
MIANTEVLKRLADHCHAAETGTFFITTTDNKACHILVETGRITALSYGAHRGQSVVAELPFIKVERFSFKQNMKMPLTSRSFVDEAVNVLESLGLHHADSQHEAKRVYRGVEIEETRVIPTLKKASSEVINKKPARMYRGRVVDD